MRQIGRHCTPSRRLFLRGTDRRDRRSAWHSSASSSAARTNLAIAPLRERIAALEGQLSTLVTLIGGGNGNARSKRAPRLLEPPK